MKKKAENPVLKIAIDEDTRYECHWTDWRDRENDLRGPGVYYIDRLSETWLSDPLDYELTTDRRNSKGWAVMPLVMELIDGAIEIVMLRRSMLWDGSKIIKRLLDYGLRIHLYRAELFVGYVRALDKEFGAHEFITRKA